MPLLEMLSIHLYRKSKSIDDISCMPAALTILVALEYYRQSRDLIAFGQALSLSPDTIHFCLKQANSRRPSGNTSTTAICTICRKTLALEEVWNCIHIGPHREQRLDVCQDCDEKGYFFWNGEIYAKLGSIAALHEDYPVRRPRKKKKA